MTVKTWTMDPRSLPDGTVLFLGISYDSIRDPKARKVYTYAALKVTGVWYFTGTGKVPQAAGWGAVERWLERDNRNLEWVKIMSAVEDVYPAPIEGRPVTGRDIVEVDTVTDSATSPVGDVEDPPWNESTPYDADGERGLDYGPRYT
jgi:hypothetical protein